MIAQRDDVAPPLPLDSVLCGDCLDVLRSLPDNSIDAIVTDPPYGLGAAPDMLDVLRAWLAGEAYTPRGKGGFMGKAWDAFVPGPEYWRECLRVLKPGGHALVFAGTRTWDVMGLALRLAGFEIRDTIGSHGGASFPALQWVHGQGFPKSLDVSKQLDKAAGAKRTERVWKDRYHDGKTRKSQEHGSASISFGCDANGNYITAPATDAARQWDGWGTGLKPAWEPIIVCRKPLSEPTVAANVLRYGTGALNIGASRVATTDKAKFPSGVVSATEAVYGGGAGRYANRPRTTDKNPAGRWPPNLLLSHAADCLPDHCSLWCPVRELDRQSGVLHARGNVGPTKHGETALFGNGASGHVGSGYARDDGGASRFFPTFRYVAKASRAERNRGLDAMPAKPSARYGRMAGTPEHGAKHDTPEANTHCCVKPLALMSWLITLITPPGGVVLDPFAGSGSTLCAAKAGGWRYIGVDREAEYVAIAEARLEATL